MKNGDVENIMSFERVLKDQAEAHPSMRPQDALKLCFQAAFGAEHLLLDLSAARRYFDAEYDAVAPRDIPLYEAVSEDFARVNLAAWKRHGYSRDALFDMFAASAASGSGGGGFEEYLGAVTSLAERGELPFASDEWGGFLTVYLQGGIRAVHHSEEYRAAERPSYRIVDVRLLRERSAES